MRTKLVLAGVLMAILLTPISVYGSDDDSYIADFCHILNMPIIRLDTVLGASTNQEAASPNNTNDTQPDTNDTPLPTIPPELPPLPTLPPDSLPPLPTPPDSLPPLPTAPPDSLLPLPTLPPATDDLLPELPGDDDMLPAPDHEELPPLPPDEEIDDDEIDLPDNEDPADNQQYSSGELPKIFMTTSALNLRPTPCTSGERLALIPVGARVEVTDFLCGEWFAVTHNGISGYMYAEFLMEPPVPAAPGTVELLDWSVVQELITLGTPITIIDVRTGLTYQVASFSNGRHADVEPLTPEDTEIMFQAFGRNWSWATRPVLAIINGRTIAASINGMPHAGSTRHDNNMDGHICLHFLGSRTHNGTASHERNHQASIQEAFDTASNW